MISSLFISVPLKFGRLCLRPCLPPSGVLTVDSAKTSPPVPRPDARRHVKKTGLCLFRGSTSRAHEALRARFAIYSNCKSIVSSVHGFRVEFFFHGKTRASFFKPARMRNLGNLADERAARLASRCTNLVSDHRRGSLVVG